jgi:hypothetical protein
MKPASDQVPALPGNRVVHQQCLACGHAWVDYEGKSLSCDLCKSEKLSPPVSLSRIREVLEEAQKKVTAGTLSAAELEDRKARLMERYTKAAPVFARHAEDTFPRVSARYLDGDLSDRCLDSLIFHFHLFTELGLHEAAVHCALLIGSGYFRRVQDKEIQDFTDLADLAAARQWFKHLGQDEWVATVDLMTGLKAGHTVLEHVRDKYTLLQISRVHLNRARQYYTAKDLPEIQRRVEKECDWINEQLSYAIGAAAQVEAAHINSQSRLDAAEIIAERLGQIADEAGNLASATKQGFGQLTGGLDLLGQRIDMAGGRVSAAIAAGSQYIGDSTRAAGYTIGSSIVHHAKETREGVRELGSEVRKSIEAAGDKAANAMSGLGTKMAFGMVGAGALNALILDGTLKEIANTVTPQVRQGLQNLKLIDATPQNPQPVRIQDVRDALLTQGLDEVNRQALQPYGGFGLQLTKQKGA